MTLLQFITIAIIGFSSEPAQLLPPPPPPLQGIYLTAATLGGATGVQMLDKLASSGGNMVVFDIQSGGKFAYPSNAAASQELGASADVIKDLPALVAQIHERKLFAVARFVLFKNGYLAAKRPAWTLKAKGTVRPFSNRDGAIWLDPSNEELLEYYRDIVRELVVAGVDEVQFDYVRFPEAGAGGAIGYNFEKDKELDRDAAITAAVKLLAEEVHYLGAKVSVDVFGIVVWDDISWRLIGQNVSALARYVDAIYPMPYPSHFGPGWGGHSNPADEPYFFVQETTKKFLAEMAGSGAVVRPWIQGFAMAASNFGTGYIKEQIRALRDIGVNEYSIWNASNNYQYSWGAIGK